MVLDPSAGEKLFWLKGVNGPWTVWTYLEVGDDGHGNALIVEGLEENVGAGTIHSIDGATKLAQQLVGLLSKINPDVTLSLIHI